MKLDCKFLMIALFIFFSTEIRATTLELSDINIQRELIERQHRPNPSIYLSDEVWEDVYDYLIPDDHPIRQTLDEIFLASRAFQNSASMKAAGFAAAKPQKFTKLIFTRHPKLSGYVIKAYLDIQKYHQNMPEQFYWMKRIDGARLIQKYIDENKYEHLLKVPKKWIYLLPDEPSPKGNYLRKFFILVEEDMDIYDEAGNRKMWKSPKVTNTLLNIIFTIAMDLGLYDSLHPLDNCPFSKDGRIAFVDTQRFNEKNVKCSNVTPYLTKSKAAYWSKLTKHRSILNTKL